MPLERLSTVLKEADQEGYAIAAFNAFNYESILWVCEAAEEEDTPIIIMFYPGFSSYIQASTFAAITKDVAAKTKVPVVLHLDHCKSFDEIVSAMWYGFTSVMIDGSSLEFEDNITATKEIVKVAHAIGADVEAELGYVGQAANPEDFVDRNHYTSPSQAAEFAQRTGVDALAIAIGNAHGNYVLEPHLDIELLKEINAAADVPLVLHGGSGIPSDQLKEAVKYGINKLNIGTEFGHLFYTESQKVLESNSTVSNMMEYMQEIKRPVKEYVRNKIRLIKP